MTKNDIEILARWMHETHCQNPNIPGVRTSWKKNRHKVAYRWAAQCLLDNPPEVLVKAILERET